MFDSTAPDLWLQPAFILAETLQPVRGSIHTHKAAGGWTHKRAGKYATCCSHRPAGRSLQAAASAMHKAHAEHTDVKFCPGKQGSTFAAAYVC